MSANIITLIISDLSHQDGNLIVGISAFQDHDEAGYCFNIWNPGKDSIHTILWNSETGYEMVNGFLYLYELILLYYSQWQRQRERERVKERKKREKNK